MNVAEAISLDDGASFSSADSFRRWLVTTSTQGVWIIDEVGATKFVNDRMAAMLGTTAEAMHGRSVRDFVEPSEHEEITHQYVEFKAGKTIKAQIRYRRADGTHFLGQIESTPVFGPDGVFAGGLGMVTDISEMKEAEEAKRVSQARVANVEAQLRQAQKMEAVGRLAGGIAHDFNNMLSVILGYGDSLLERVKGQPDVYEDMGEIITAAKRAAELTRQLLLFSRRMPVKNTVVDVAELTAGMLRMIERIVGEDVQVSYDPYSYEQPPLVDVDRSGLEQILMNLVVNARDAMPSGGRLKIALGASGENIVLRVSDNGSGMDEATIARAFDPFFTTKELGKGTGLGLATVYGIVEQARGSIRIESAPGAGSTFEIRFPRTKEPDPVVIAPARYEPSLQRARILLVEDEEQVRAVTKRALERQGHYVIEAKSSLEALESEREFELLLTDVIMPLMSGAELARRMTKARPRLKVLFMSGYADDSIGKHGIISASVAYLQKPFTPTDLSRKVREVLEAS